MKNIGLLTVRNEVDVIDEFFDDAEKYFDEIVVMDDSSDGSREKIASRKSVKYLAKFEDVYAADGPRTDGQKQHLLEYIFKNYGAGVWITVLNSDAFFGDDPNKSAEMADSGGFDLVHWVVYNFHPSLADEADYIRDPVAWSSTPIQSRLKWIYDHQWFESMQFKLLDGMEYNPKRHGRIVPLKGWANKSVATFKPLLLHYPLRSPEQIEKKRADRMKTGFRVERYFAPWIENGGFVKEPHPFFKQMVRWEDKKIPLFSL